MMCSYKEKLKAKLSLIVLGTYPGILAEKEYIKMYNILIFTHLLHFKRPCGQSRSDF